MPSMFNIFSLLPLDSPYEFINDPKPIIYFIILLKVFFISIDLSSSFALEFIFDVNKTVVFISCSTNFICKDSCSSNNFAHSSKTFAKNIFLFLVAN